ncbi:hypothetical protein [Gemmobacter sp. LW-1]|uniref:hypothetical protein n=1 Tax=Gemmobacter sp. LW-1 TaxID=1529005 RepID=UPI0006C740A4|nr:hypothetical protein [Gemmobacter sp. LW-1]
MAVTIKQAEAIPATYPDSPEGLSADAAALDAAMIWQRIEAWIAHRWTARAVVWTVEGPGEWVPPLTPATVQTVEAWQADAWVEVFPPPSPLGGYVLACDVPYRITATVGSGTPPAAVLEAFRRLAEYMAEDVKPSMRMGRAGVSSMSYSIGSAIDVKFDRNPAWMARALVNSGAGDLLRPYRRA